MHPLLIALAACTPPAVDELLVLSRVGDGEYALTARTVPDLHEPHRLSGSLGDGQRGGFFGLEGYRTGEPMDVHYVVHDGVGVATEEDGLVVWSFYAHLSDLRADLGAVGHDVEPIFPLDAIAWNPVSVQDYAAVENAAYAPGAHVFLLFPDALKDGVPLAANAGVVRHEFGHAWFQLLTAGDPHVRPPYERDDAAFAIRALNEGFADMVATLSLDDPDFFSDSIVQPSRDVRGDAVAEPWKYPPASMAGLDALSFDPYALGTVFASMAWDVREATDEPDRVLKLAVTATRAWAEERAWADVDRWAWLFVDTAIDEALGASAACASLRDRFPHAPEPPRCSE